MQYNPQIFGEDSSLKTFVHKDMQKVNQFLALIVHTTTVGRNMYTYMCIPKNMYYKTNT